MEKASREPCYPLSHFNALSSPFPGLVISPSSLPFTTPKTGQRRPGRGLRRRRAPRRGFLLRRRRARRACFKRTEVLQVVGQPAVVPEELDCLGEPQVTRAGEIHEPFDGGCDLGHFLGRKGRSDFGKGLYVVLSVQGALQTHGRDQDVSVRMGNLPKPNRRHQQTPASWECPSPVPRAGRRSVRER
jgi:hypothetical protein